MKLPIRASVAGSPEYPFVAVDAPVKLDQNEASEDFPAALKAQVFERLATLPWNRYPDLNGESLSAAIGRFDDWPAGGVVATTGSNVLIALLTQLAGMGQRVLTVKPNFALYALDAQLLDAPLTEVALRPDFSLDLEGLIAALQAPGEAPGVLYLPQPHAPTGAMARPGEIERLIEAAPGWIVVIDEAYHQFAGQDARALARRHPNVVIMRTFSKAWGLAGVRLGYALCHEDVARQLRKLVPPFGLSVLQTVVAEVALENPAFMQARVEETIRERERVSTALAARADWQVIPSQANFILIRTPDAPKALAELLARGVLVRKQDSYFGLKGCIRVTIGLPHENDAFLRAAGVA